MRFAKAGLFSGAPWGALLLLCGCTVPDGPPVPGSTPLTALTGRELLDVCEWAYDYMGGSDYQHPESDDEEHAAIHVCPPTEEELAFPARSMISREWSTSSPSHPALGSRWT